MADPLREIEELERDPVTHSIMLRKAIEFQERLEWLYGSATDRILAGVHPQDDR